MLSKKKNRCLAHCATSEIKAKLLEVLNRMNSFLPEPVLFPNLNPTFEKDQHYTARIHARWRESDIEMTEEGAEFVSMDKDVKVFVRPHQKLAEISWLCAVPEHRAVVTKDHGAGGGSSCGGSVFQSVYSKYSRGDGMNSVHGSVYGNKSRHASSSSTAGLRTPTNRGSSLAGNSCNKHATASSKLYTPSLLGSPDSYASCGAASGSTATAPAWMVSFLMVFRAECYWTANRLLKE